MAQKFYINAIAEENHEYPDREHDCGCHKVKRCEKICKVKSKETWSEKVYTNDLCADTATIKNLCVTNLNAVNVKGALANNYRAYIDFTSDLTYTLGTDINFNNIIDDPSSGISFSPSTHYTAPVSGYYLSNVFIDFSKLSGSVVIAGIPVAALSVWVNGILRESSFVPFLSFSLSQQGSLTNTLLLTAGDQVTTKLDVLILDPATGLQPYVGTVLVKGGGLTTPAASNFSIVLLTPMTGTTPITCQDCPMVTITGCDLEDC